ncbi:hypothetical protein ACHAXA_003710 [Cyclostephanos tholiformis]|uniref:RING-type domain-containing protein n=1 Tax=Cyclostephanos tholiformis TaxID=382380 RepID=A0ABD3RZ92_9STRA
MTASLILTPLSLKECCALLKEKGKFLTPGCPPVPVEEHVRNTITLKLCSRTDDVINVDDDEIDDIVPGRVEYARKYDDGSTAATIILGRQKYTGIKCVAISRALCDISLTEKKTSASSSSSSLFASMRMRKPPNTAHVATPSFKDVGDLLVTTSRSNNNNHHVHLDGELVKAPLGGEIPLTNGSIIALYGEIGFAYRVSILQHDDDGGGEFDDVVVASSSADLVCGSNNGPNKRMRANPPVDVTTTHRAEEGERRQPTERERIRQRAHRVMMEEFTCAMCMDVLVRSTFAYPCSHAFCENCSKCITNAAVDAKSICTFSSSVPPTALPSNMTKGKCPTCRGDVMEWMPARSYDTQVWSFALQGCFDRSDAEDYLDRRRSMGEDPPTEEERLSILNICEGEEEGEDTHVQKSTVGSGGAVNVLPSYVTSLSTNKQPEMSRFIGALPQLNSSAVGMSDSSNGMQVVDLAGYLPPELEYRVKSADNDVICID